MVTREERESIINETVERVFKLLPETIGNLMKSHAMIARLNKEFYEAHQDYKNHKDIVTQTLARVEGNNPLKSYEDVIKMAIPEIDKRIGLTRGLNNSTPEQGNLSLRFDSINGEL
jgi:hypothetical protein